VHAQESTSDEIILLNQKIEQKQQSIDQINRQIDSFRSKIEAKEQEKDSLNNELEILENRIAKAELDQKAVETQIDLVNAQIDVIEHDIHKLEKTLARNKDLIVTILQKIEIQDGTLALQLLFGSDSFSEFFDDLEKLQAVNSELKNAVDSAKESKIVFLSKHQIQQEKKEQLTTLSKTLQEEQTHLANALGAKETLLQATQNSEEQYKELLNDLKQEQDYVNNQIGLLQKEIEGKLTKEDVVESSSVFSWPLDPSKRGISTYFHDPTYPFRHLFEHMGLDLPAVTGTPVRSSAPGYVAWTKKGAQYGNYVMVIHANGMATLYAHLSRIDVSADQFVSRGDQIGAVGSTGLSTGPHLHFEIRKNGIPINPLNYLLPY